MTEGIIIALAIMAVGAFEIRSLGPVIERVAVALERIAKIAEKEYRRSA